MLTWCARVLLTMMLLVALAPIPASWAGAPTDQLRDGVARVFKILKDPAMQGDVTADRRRGAVLKAASEIFDFAEMAKQSLGTHWAQRTPAERQQFVRLYTQLIQRSYISKVDRNDTVGEMAILGETIDGDDAVVRTTIPLGEGRRLPLEYRMQNKQSRWWVYDISIDGISLVANYRAQFNKVIRTESYEALVTKFEAKQAQAASPSSH